MRRPLAVGVVLALAGPLAAVAVATTPAQAAPAVPAAAPVAGVAGALCRTGVDPAAPPGRQVNDTTPVRKRDLDAVPHAPVTPAGVAARPDLRFPPPPRRVTIPVYVHVVKGTHRGERVPAGPRKVKRVIKLLNRGFRGKQHRDSPNTRYRFRLRDIDYTKRDGWHHAFLFGPRDRRMKRALHRGNARTLNLYITGGGPDGQPVLGWSRFPWQYRKTPKLDGVTVNWRALPGGTMKHYRSGDTVIHEVGHWMGLFHTFEHGCHKRGDLVDDTPAEQSPNYYCPKHRDTCPAPGKDPIHNFMDYSYDRCMNRFTPGQVDRMDRSWARYRR